MLPDPDPHSQYWSESTTLLKSRTGLKTFIHHVLMNIEVAVFEEKKKKVFVGKVKDPDPTSGKF
jgi:hypothetical protein